MFLSFILNNKMLILVIILLAIITGGGIYVKILKSDEATLVAQKETISTQLAESQANLLQLQTSIQDQNSAIDKLKSAADERVAQHAVGIQQANAVAATYKQKADALLKSRVPVNTSSCSASNDLINLEIRNAHK